MLAQSLSTFHRMRTFIGVHLFLQGEFYLGGMTMPSTNGGSSSDAGVDDVDGHAIDPVRTQQAIEHLQHKIHKTMDLIKGEQNAKEGSFNFRMFISKNYEAIKCRVLEKGPWLCSQGKCMNFTV